MGLLASDDGELLPTSERYIPSNCSSMADEFASYFFLISGVEINIGCNLFSDTDFASTSVGYTIIVGAGSCIIMYPIIF